MRLALGYRGCRVRDCTVACFYSFGIRSCRFLTAEVVITRDQY